MATHEWLLHINWHSGLSRSDPQRPPDASRKRDTETLPLLLNPLSATSFQGISQMGTSLPCLFQVWFGAAFCSCGEEGWKGYRRWWRRAWRTGDKKAGETALPSSERPFIKGGLLSETAEEGWEINQDSRLPKKRSNRHFRCLFWALPKTKLQI